MWKSRLFWKLFTAYSGLILAAAVILGTIISARQKQLIHSYLQTRLRDDAEMLSSQVLEELAAAKHDRLQDLTRELAGKTGTRLTIIAVDGVALADSEQDPKAMENHRDRPEIVAAAANEIGVQSHISRTLGIPMMYLAMRADYAGKPVGFVRVALPLQDVDRQVAAVRRLIWSITFAVALATLAVTNWIVVRILRPVARLRDAAQAISSGDYGQKVFVPNRDELGHLGDAFNRMSVELAQRVSQIRGDRELLATVLGGMIEGVIAVDASERILFANDAARELLNLPVTEITGRPIWELVRHGSVQSAVQKAHANDLAYRSEFDIPGTARRTVSLHASRLPGNPSPGVVLVLHDVTELRRLENLRRDFVANVSHELKTPLSAIKAYAETLQAGALEDPESNRSFVRQIEEQADRLHALILDLLSLARIESGQEAFEIVPLRVCELVETSVSQCLAAAASKKLIISVQPGDSLIRILADFEGMREILDNLLNNAIKYTPENGHITVRWRADGVMGLIEVEDSGIGIPVHEQSRIFERFYRVDKARSRELGGTGLGLSIVKHLVQAFGGTISLTSQVGHGSTFSIRLPLA